MEMLGLVLLAAMAVIALVESERYPTSGALQIVRGADASRSADDSEEGE
jgi:hypothetical protein